MQWAKRLKRAVKSRGFTVEDKEAAGSWPTCAVGEGFELLNGEIDRIYRDETTDSEVWLRLHYPLLHQLGFDFNDAVFNDEAGKARRLHRCIQRVFREVFQVK